MQDFLHYLTLPYLWGGAVLSVELMIGALIGGVIVGFFLALASLSRHAWLRMPVQAYIYILRGTPVLLQLILIYNVLPQFGLMLPAFTSALLALTINETAFCAEIIRGGIQATSREQRIAAQAFGFSRRTEMVSVVIPQALRAILPPLGNEAIGLLKSTSLASVVGVNELTMRGQTIVSQNFLFIPVLVASGAIYVVLSTLVALAQWWLERRVGLEHRAQRARRSDGLAEGRPPRAEAPPLPLRVRSPEAAYVLDIDDLHVAYGGRAVLKGVTLRVRRGEVVVLLGRSGSGKSTLLKSILALAPVSKGKVVVEGLPIGQDVNGRPLPERLLPANRAASAIGIVFQHFALFDHMTALENAMSVPRLVQKLPFQTAESKAQRALATVGLGAYANRLPHELSGGQQQRVGIARALAADPNVLLFDEPTSALDPELVREVNQTIRKLAGTGMTMLISTHDIAFAASVADRIVFLQDGVLVEEGPRDCIEAPQTAAFAAFLRQEREAEGEGLEADEQSEDMSVIDSPRREIAPADAVAAAAPSTLDLPFAAEAEAALGPALYRYLIGAPRDAMPGMDDRNAEDFRRFRLLPRVLRGAAGIDISTDLAGRRFAGPLVIGAFAGDKVFHPDGLLALARVGRRLNLPLVVSEETVTPLRELTAAHDACWLQLRAAGPQTRIFKLIDLAADAGAQGMVMTVFAPVHPVAGLQPGNFSIGAEIRRRGWSTIGAIGGFPGDDGLGVAPLPAFPGWGWNDVAATIAHARARGLPLLLKGILRADDAEAAQAAGAAGIVVSNLGLRQSSRWASPLAALPAVAAAVPGAVALDGGIRHGTDALVARCLGATMSVAARPVATALVGGGEGAVEDLLRGWLDEIQAVASWLGVGRLDELGPDFLVEEDCR